MIAKEFTSEAGHWYSRDGIPRYTIIGKNGNERNTTLRDARTENLVPSVTTILNIAAKPALMAWLQEQVLMASLTLPKLNNEAESDYIKRIIHDSKQQGRAAADKGTEIHAAVQNFYEGKQNSQYETHVIACNKALIDHFGQQAWVSERSFGHDLGFGGKCDLYTPSGQGIVADVKTKDFGVDDKIAAYDEHLMQLSAYRVGLGVPNARCANIFLSRTDPSLAIVKEWTAEDLDRGWLMFCSLLKFWQLKNKYQ